jgi:hypothetical protein
MPFFGQFRVYRSQAVRHGDSAIGTHRAAAIFTISISDSRWPLVIITFRTLPPHLPPRIGGYVAGREAPVFRGMPLRGQFRVGLL